MDKEFLNFSVGLMDVFNYVQGTSQSRCIEQGEQILKCHHLITCGIKSLDVEKRCMEVLGLCLQSSGVNNSFPHTIEGTFQIGEDRLIIDKFHCSCKGGAAGICKHCVAVLLYCNRNSIEDIDKLSVTDVKCLWAEKKQTTQCWYETVPITDFCCFTQLEFEDIHISKESADNIRQELIDLLPECALAKHAKRRRLEPLVSQPEVTHEDREEKDCLLKILNSELEFTLEVPELMQDCWDFYCKEIKSSDNEAKNFAELKQNSSGWFAARKNRITASRCYELYTYTKNKKPDWEKKIKNYINNSFKGNFATRHGIQAEAQARTAYEKSLPVKVLNVGTIVRPGAEWLGCSPDGLVYSNGSLHVLEIKCPVNGMKETATDVVKVLQYIELNALKSCCLKKNHKYYAQIQLQLYLTGGAKGILVIFASYDETFVTIEVAKDMAFIKKMVTALHNVYFDKMLPILVANVLD